MRIRTNSYEDDDNSAEKEREKSSLHKELKETLKDKGSRFFDDFSGY